MKDLMEPRLARAQELAAEEIATIASRYLRRKMDPSVVANLRAEINAAVELALRAEQLDALPRYVLVDLDRVHGSIVIGASVPIWEHDCTECTFLGRVGTVEEPVDLYTCAGHEVFPGYRTFIARLGDEGGQYSSAPAHALEQTKYFHPALYEALRRWRLTS